MAASTISRQPPAPAAAPHLAPPPPPMIPKAEEQPQRAPPNDPLKSPAKSKSVPGPSGTRFQCPRCPKNFSRIENLTRHQANHEDVGKFACVICRKRFTRSDLLNRHRRIHGAQAEPPKSHVTRGDYTQSSPSQQPDARGFENLAHGDDRRSASQEGSSGYPAHSANDDYQNHPSQRLYGHADAYQHPLQHQLPGTNMSGMHSQASEGLNSLMEAALAPQGTFSFTPLENINPLNWDGFMRYTDAATPYMGSYDADMSWTLDYLPSESSPNFLLEHDMLNAYDDFGDIPYQYQPLHYEQPTPVVAHDPDDADGEDDDTTDWPDKVIRSESPDHRLDRIVPRVQAISWTNIIEESIASGLTIETIRPAQIFNDSLRDMVLQSLDGTSFGRNEISAPEISDLLFPPAEVLDFFLRLYIRYVQPRFPVLHLPTFDIYHSHPLLLIAMMFLGSGHSRVDRGRFSLLFHEHLRIAVIRIQESDKTFLRSADNILTYFLSCLAGTWSGSKQSYEFAEGGRGILVTACRRARLLDCRPPTGRIEFERYQRPGGSLLEANWLAWVDAEKRKRLGLSIYIFDCQYPALFNNQPYVSKAETTNCVFPCGDEYWDAPTADAWKMQLGPADMPPSTYCLHALNCCLLRKYVKPPPTIAQTGEFGKIVLMYALHTHIFEWRQATSMLNPTGMMGTFGNSSVDIGEGLRDRRRWLVAGLDSFAECYQTSGITPSAILLHHLGYIALDVSLSDIHLVAGRSTNKHDANFAEDNLKHWANSEIADSTMSHVYNMLELAHNCINNGTTADNSFEVAICLFTGGMVCWAFAKLRANAPWEQYVQQVRKASAALRQMGCWRMCSMYGRILNGFEIQKTMPV